VDSPQPVGSAMAHLAIESRKWKEFDTDQSAHQNIYDRGLELRMAYPNSQAEYLALENRFTSDVNKRWIWVDGTPKNVLLNPNFQPAFIDFGLSCFADQQHTLPGFLSHLAVYLLSGILDRSMVLTYLGKAVDGYDSVDYLDEEAFCEYFGMEVLHRSMGKRVPGIDKASQKIALLEFGLRVFDDNISTVGALIRLLATSGK